MNVPRRNRRRYEEASEGPSEPHALANPDKHRARTCLLAALLVVVVLAAFYPSLGNDFNFDDEKNILDNRDYRGLGPANLRWMFSTFHMGHYQPLSWVSLGLDYVLWGKKPWGYHLTNLVLHAANAVLVFLLARRLLRLSVLATPRDDTTSWPIDIGSIVAALLFAVHPLRVESVAWVTERRDVLSSFFLLFTILFYLRAHEIYEQSRRRWFLSAAVVTFLLSLLSRAMGVTLPLILLVLDAYPLKRLGGGRGRYLGREVCHVWIEKIPFVVLAAVAAILAPIAQHHVGATVELARHGIDGRIAQASYGLAFYLYKSLFPIDLSPMYELRLPLNILASRYVLSALFVLVFVTAMALLRRRYPALVAVAICYVVLLLPVLGFAQSGPQEVADRYSYLPSIGWAMLLGGITSRLRRKRQRSVAAVTAIVIVTLSVLTWRQCVVWRNSTTLWTHATRYGPPAASAHYNLACALAKSGDKEAAIGEFHKSIEVNPLFASAYYNLSNCLYETAHIDEAIRGYRRVLELDPTFGRAHYELGRVYGEQRRFKEAKDEYREAIRVSKDLVKAYINLGVILAAEEKDHAAAMELYRRALAIRPNHRDANYNLAISLEAVGKDNEAASYYRETIRVDPAYPNAHVNLGNVLARQGQVNEALAEYREALRIAPNHPAAKANFDGLMNRLGKKQ